MPDIFNGTAYTLQGPEDGPPVALIHGLGMNHAMWQWQVPALGSYRVLSYDLYSHGASGPAPRKPDLGLLAEQLRALLDHVGIRHCAVVGFSLGGMICRRFAMDFPDRVTALGILHSAHARTEAARQAVQKRVEQARIDGPSATVEAALERWFSADFRNLRPDVMDLVRTWVLANDIGLYPDMYQVLVDGVDELVAPEPAIACPTLVMTGDEDYGNSPEMSHAIAAEIAGSETVILPGLRHMALAEDPDRVNAILLDFLNRVSGASGNG